MSDITRRHFRILPVFTGLAPLAFSTQDLPNNPLRAPAEWIPAAAECGRAEPQAMCGVSAERAADGGRQREYRRPSGHVKGQLLSPADELEVADGYRSH